ncbi:hypothetical protein PROFUN_16193 [Planoprotostelium fungivorum]|uniref:Uncharacterized protein n=1 Tax=Planoprotostelium fungivorum TaxID=1890364 RepID=A0A2P6MS12_9EUKA|nr:hypothetical protein PROFUN_16193 [Planoprotostelium fungivorum]
MAWLRAQKLDKTYDRGKLPHTTQAKILPIYLCTDVQKDCHAPLPVPQFTYISFVTFFWVSPLDCRVQSYQLASNGLVAPDGVKLISE